LREPSSRPIGVLAPETMTEPPVRLTDNLLQRGRTAWTASCHDSRMLTRIDHVGLAVRDLDEAIAFYARTFDVQVVHEEVNEEQGVREAMLDVGGSGGARIQLLAPLRPDSPIAKFLERSGEGIQQVAYGVEDIDAVSDELRARGVRLLYDAPRRGTAGSRVNFVHPKDAMGVLVELVEAAAG
jgi:methylmalonyl-CoA/ethylmalonyl-CoA epimerase